MNKFNYPISVERLISFACLAATPVLLASLGCSSDRQSMARATTAEETPYRVAYQPPPPQDAPRYAQSQQRYVTTYEAAPARTQGVYRTNAIGHSYGLIDPYGPIGNTEASGTDNPAGQAPGLSASIVNDWQAFRTIGFDAGSEAMRNGDMPHIDAIADYLQQNPAATVGIDAGSASSPDTLRVLSLRRSNSVRQALIAAGVPNHRITTGAYTNAANARDNRVEVLLRVGNNSAY